MGEEQFILEMRREFQRLFPSGIAREGAIDGYIGGAFRAGRLTIILFEKGWRDRLLETLKKEANEPI